MSLATIFLVRGYTINKSSKSLNIVPIKTFSMSPSQNAKNK
jgi:hypothetical protein